MSRDNLSSAAVRSLMSESTSEGYLFKLMIEHPDWAEPYRFIADRGFEKRTDAALNDWICYPFDAKLPDDRDDEITSAQLIIDNVDRQIVQAIRQISTPPTVTLWLSLLTDIDDILAGPFPFSLNSVSWNSLTVSGSLEYEPILNLRFPAHAMDPLTTPGLFKS